MVQLSLFFIAASALAGERKRPAFELRQYVVTTQPYESIYMPRELSSQALLNARYQGDWTLYKSFSIHCQTALFLATPQSKRRWEEELAENGMSVFDVPTKYVYNNPLMAGVGLQSPQLFDLRWTPSEDAETAIQARIDSLYLQMTLNSVTLKLGRQPIDFGNGWLARPFNLIIPFSYAVIDSETPTGVDAISMRARLWKGADIVMALSYVGDLNYIEFWTPNRTNATLYGEFAFGPSKLSLLAAANQGDQVFGAGAFAEVGLVQIHADVTWTLADHWLATNNNDDHLRLVTGIRWNPSKTLGVRAEFYHQSVGQDVPRLYLTTNIGEPYQRGEIFLMGQAYGMATVEYAIDPTIKTSLKSILNLRDGSSMLSPSLSFVISENSQLKMGGFFGIGEESLSPTLDDFIYGHSLIESEFGLFPNTYYLRLTNSF